MVASFSNFVESVFHMLTFLFFVKAYTIFKKVIVSFKKNVTSETSSCVPQIYWIQRNKEWSVSFVSTGAED